MAVTITRLEYFFYDGRNEKYYEDDNVMNMLLIIMEGNYVTIDDDDSSCHGYYIIKLFSSTYTLQTDLSIYGQVMSSSEMVHEKNYDLRMLFHTIYGLFHWILIIHCHTFIYQWNNIII